MIGILELIIEKNYILRRKLIIWMNWSEQQIKYDRGCLNEGIYIKILKIVQKKEQKYYFDREIKKKSKKMMCGITNKYFISWIWS